MEKTRILLAGFGAMSKLAWFPLLLQHPEVELVACVDACESAFQSEIASGRICSGKCYTDFDKAVKESRPQAVVIVTPPDVHEEVCAKAARSGLAVLCEKPLAHSFESARRMVDCCAENGVSLMVAQNRRHTAAIHTMQKYIAEKLYGEPGQAYVQFRQIFTRDSYRDSMLHPLLMDMANHHLDAARYVLGQDPVAVSATGWNPPWSRFAGISSAVCVFEYDSPLRLVYDASWHTMNGEMTSNGCDWRIECENGVLLCRKDIVYGIPKGDHASGSYGGEPEPLEMVALEHDTVVYLLNEFLSAITGTGSIGTTGEDNLKTLSAVFAAIEAVDTQRKVSLN